ncbi:MAG: helix-turn-helix transcriptional regulator [Oscillospiraceae bacterium]|nr:helix-turn-helix transcriptional regulator [Oscillospiraceae bacterium]
MISDKKSNKKDPEKEYFGSTGQKIRKTRERKGVPAPQLAANCGITKGAMSLYENGLRQVGDEKRKAIADALGVSDYALKDHQLHDSSDILFTLFEMAEMGYLKPVVTEDSVGVQIMNPDLHDAILVWNEKYQQKLDGTLSQEEFDEWKDSFSLDKVVPPEKIVPQPVGNGSSSEEIRSLQMLRQTMEYDIGRVEHCIENDDVVGIWSMFKVLKTNLLNWLDRDIESMIEKNETHSDHKSQSE